MASASHQERTAESRQQEGTFPAMATTLVHLAADEFERLPEGDRKFELGDGVLIEVEISAC